ncbi:50S ribosomal protein L18 [Intestinicryptomonas porci]|uniref:Large ribosomal subunit protein uL18 n=1 Tax=Intestinicryptomonas porci TaxID=2926320 RepID=A0ABU4WEE8_9BACT|nr:50S ribosomal protein L18 [Opitutales bacterium CLA-KB-P66]
MKLEKKKMLAQKRRWRVRSRVFGTAERPRLVVRFSNKHICAQCIDDKEGKTLVSLCSLSKELNGEKILANVAGAVALGSKLGEKMKSAGVTAVVLDRGSRRYHGCVKSFADAVRQTGINF